MTDKEYAEILASLMYLYVERYNCFNSEKFMYQGEFSELLQKEHKIQNCCDVVSEDPDNWHYAGDSGILYKTCVCNFYDKQIHLLLELESNYDKTGTLPQSLGINKISNKLKSALSLIKSYRIDYEKAELEKIRNKNKIKTGRNG